MNCHRCQTSLKHWRTHCPQCGAQLLPLPYSTISDSATPARARRTPLVKSLRLSLLVLALVGLAVTARLNSARSSGQSSAQNAAPARRASAALSPTPAPAVPAAEESGPPPPAVAEATAAAATARLPRPAAPPSEFRAEPAAKLVATSAVAANAPALTAPPATASAAPARPAETAAPKADPPQRADIAMPKLPSVTQSVEARAGLEVEGGAVLLSRHTALLTVKSYVPARIYIDGAYSGVTPRSVKLVAGEHTVTLVADGFQEWTRKVRLNGQEQAGILASLKKPGAAGGQ
jgi:hypothetical protein